MISVAVCDATTHCRSPSATENVELFGSGARYSKPRPLMVRSAPPPAEPAAGEMEVIAMTDWKVRLAGTTASPKVGTCTSIGCTPGGALDATHVRLVEPSPLSTAATEVHA